MERKNRIPITRLSRLYDETDFDLDLESAMDIIENDMNFTVVLYRIDRVHSNNEDVYGESETREIRFLEPVELKVVLRLDEAENESYDKDGGRLRYQEYGNLTFFVLLKHLEEKKVDIQYGDIVGYSDRENNLKYFEVSNDGKISSDNKHTLFGYKSYYRTIECVVIDPDRFNGL